VKFSDRSYIYVPYIGLLRYNKSNIYIGLIEYPRRFKKKSSEGYVIKLSL